MIFKKSIIVGIALVLSVGCTQQTEGKSILVASDVTKMEIVSNGSDNPKENSVKALNRQEIKRFVEMWNSSESIGVCKFYPEYKMHVYLKKGGHKTFRLSDTSIKENDDNCYQLDYKKLVNFIEE